LAAEAYRSLRTSILFSTPGHAPKTLLVTSSLPLEGKSLTAVNLASVMAKAGSDILLVDADLRRPSLHKLFQVPQEPGLTNFLVGEMDEVPAVPTEVPHLFLVPCGHIPPNPSELVGSESMQAFLAKALGQFARVIIDSPPLLSVTDPAILATQVEGVLLVVKAETVPRRVAMEAKDQLLGVRAHLLGTLLNDVSLKRDGYYYRHYYRYHHHYSADGASRAEKQGAKAVPPRGSGLWSRIKKTLHKHQSLRG
jgi:capsular exopolysaccharide synthesis family protein